MVMVGITEEFSKSLELLLELTGMEDFQEDGHHVNVGNAKTKHVLSAVERAEVEENLKYDIELYAYAKARFKRDVAAMEARKEAAKQL
tara:strand:+ start:345 stop:608 length:264 start_codon:yes stop_codon:yes gene_type:complete